MWIPAATDILRAISNYSEISAVFIIQGNKKTRLQTSADRIFDKEQVRSYLHAEGNFLWCTWKFYSSYVYIFYAISCMIAIVVFLVLVSPWYEVC